MSNDKVEEAEIRKWLSVSDHLNHIHEADRYIKVLEEIGIPSNEESVGKDLWRFADELEKSAAAELTWLLSLEPAERAQAGSWLSSLEPMVRDRVLGLLMRKARLERNWLRIAMLEASLINRQLTFDDIDWGSKD